MQFSTLFLTAAAATLASAVKLTNSGFAVTAGSPFTITWEDAEGPVTLLLKNGPSTALTTVSTIGSGLTGSSYAWTPSSSLDSSLYAIEIQDSTSTPNYSEQFQVSGATAVASTVTASSTSASSASASESSTSGTSTSGTSTGSSTGSSSTASSTSAASSTSGASTSNGTSTSASSSPTASGNSSTTLSSSTSASRTSSTSSRASSSSSTGGSSTATSAPTSAAAEFASPLAFIFLAFAAIVTLN
ncbi:hypothetical protein BOTCAL_0073g00370 [Botryotinia calthae]|uniref:Yeast cell wall synthesis Kre9/Knh1-like N-terminal domain-containing protein n=1 Tax=Botryotinia calthae TaxID=38488 RepID=A0A4Y8D942_9HELO|nr:hypothetical protein BOTCAL_0073g00370 [Botryotinia calthae]